MISRSARYLLLSEYSKKFSSISALRLVWNIPFEVFDDCGTSLFEEGSRVALSFSTKTRLPSEPESNKTHSNFCLKCLLLRCWWWPCLDVPLITAIMAVVLPSGGSFLGRILFFLKYSLLLAWWRHHDVTSFANRCCAYVIGRASNSSGDSFHWTRGSKAHLYNSFS